MMAAVFPLGYLHNSGLLVFTPHRVKFVFLEDCPWRGQEECGADRRGLPWLLLAAGTHSSNSAGSFLRECDRMEESGRTCVGPPAEEGSSRTQSLPICSGLSCSWHSCSEKVGPGRGSEWGDRAPPAPAVFIEPEKGYRRRHTQEEDAHDKDDSENQKRTDPVNPLILAFQTPGLGDNLCLLDRPHGLWYLLSSSQNTPEKKKKVCEKPLKAFTAEWRRDARSECQGCEFCGPVSLAHPARLEAHGAFGSCLWISYLTSWCLHTSRCETSFQYWLGPLDRCHHWSMIKWEDMWRP